MTGFVIIALIAIAIGGVGVISIQELQAVDSLLFDQNLGGMGFTGDTFGNFQGLRYSLIKYNMATPDEEKEAAQKEIQETIKKIDDLMVQYAALANRNNPEIAAQLDANIANWNSIEENIANGARWV